MLLSIWVGFQKSDARYLSVRLHTVRKRVSRRPPAGSRPQNKSLEPCVTGGGKILDAPRSAARVTRRQPHRLSPVRERRFVNQLHFAIGNSLLIDSRVHRNMFCLIYKKTSLKFGACKISPRIMKTAHQHLVL
jgi:hypothetical protein